ncbi:zinc-binding protein, partial [Vibrio xuii]
MNKITPIALGITLAVSSFAQAEEGFRQHSAHVHGVVEFNIAQDANELLMEITAPGADVVGFEHAPQTDEQKHQLEAAVTQLKDANSIFTLAASAGCKIEHKSVTHTLGEDSHKGHDHHDDHKGHDHHDDHEHHDEHQGHDHHDDHEHHDEHKGHDHHDDHEQHDANK